MRAQQKPKSQSQTLAKKLLSLWIIFHLIVIFGFANSGSYWARHWSQYFAAYANVLGLNTTWNFYSPDPAHTMYYHATVYFRDERTPQDLFFPEEKEKMAESASSRRWLYGIRFLTLDMTRLKSVLGPWLCRRFPDARKVHFEHVTREIPTLDIAVDRLKTPFAELINERTFSYEDVSCSEDQEGQDS